MMMCKNARQLFVAPQVNTLGLFLLMDAGHFDDKRFTYIVGHELNTAVAQ
jgi:hypothetical protein